MELTEQEIREGSEILALFEGSNFCNDDIETYPNGYFIFEDTGAIESKDMVYHTSYDWLMPVWVKFRDMMETYPPTNQQDFLDGYSHLQLIKHAIADKPITEAFRALVSAVKWYNSIQKK